MLPTSNYPPLKTGDVKIYTVAAPPPPQRHHQDKAVMKTIKMNADACRNILWAAQHSNCPLNLPEKHNETPTTAIFANQGGIKIKDTEFL